MLKLMNWLFDSSTNWWGRFASYVDLSPLVLRIRVTNRCNLSCHYCYVGSSLNQKIESPLSIEEWKQIFKNLPRFTLIDITGGEPLLAPGIKDLLTELLDRKMKVSLISNGTVHKDDIFKLMVEKKLMHFMLSLDGPEAIHDEVRGKGHFEKTMKTASRIAELKNELKSSYPKIVAKVTVTEANVDQLTSFCDYLINEAYFDGVTLNLLFQNAARDGFADGETIEEIKFTQGNTVEFDPSKIASLVFQITKVKTLYTDRIQIRPDISLNDLENYFLSPKSMMPKNCFKYNSVVTVYQDGVMTPCDLGLKVANIRDIDFKVGRIFKEKRMKQFNRFMKKTSSQKLAGCGGCCLKKHELVT